MPFGVLFDTLALMTEAKIADKKAIIQKMFEAGAHYGYGRTRRHPSAGNYIYGTKNRVELFDLEKTNDLLETAKNIVRTITGEGGQVLFVSGKQEATALIRQEAEKVGAPFVAGRWIGGTITNFGEIRKRIEHMEDLVSKREKGELAKYTKLERLRIDREIDDLRKMFDGLVSMKSLPKALFIIDVVKEKTAHKEAKSKNIPVISLSSTDCNFKEIDYPVPANDTSFTSIAFFVKQIAEAYSEGKKLKTTSQTSSSPAII